MGYVSLVPCQGRHIASLTDKPGEGGCIRGFLSLQRGRAKASNEGPSGTKRAGRRALKQPSCDQNGVHKTIEFTYGVREN
jgi:hypothetical protein